MSDPVSILTTAWSLATLCIQIVNSIKHVIESTKETKNALLRLLDQTERVRLYLLMMRGLTAQLLETEERSLALPFNPEACEKTINQLEQLVNKIQNASKSNKLLQAIKYMQNEGAIVKIVKDMHEQEQIIGMVLNFIAAHSSVRTKAEIATLTQNATSQSKARNPFEDRLVTGDNEGSSNSDAFEPSEGPAYFPTTWFGQVTRDEQSQAYLAARDALSDAAWQGQWEGIRSSLAVGYHQHHELWANASRMQPANQLQMLTFWTPLHQAAYLCAPIPIVEDLLKNGALRTLRTGKTDEVFLYKDLTAAEIASDLGFEELAKLLYPVIRHSVPHHTLEVLQKKFHDLIQGELPQGINPHQLRLPDLTVLTELEEPEMWFPIRKDGEIAMGFAFRLDGRELLVRSSSVDNKEGQLFRITQDDVRFIEEAVAFGK